MAQPMTNFAGPMKGAQQTFVRMQGPIPIKDPFKNASMDKSLLTGIEKATVAEKKMRIIHDVARLVCFTQT
eukprot:CAMPEP_0115649656 /NCGR_PEP_ID=MMETSP0272-20121206/40610_1 /TAXON_ID=71861 /ORGANISM="Scrippsiella trochoidea, Strain CCMP3099" /LENGTH=70 /DNA_ID=CAMNT_0003087325 /DNA_START=99 /DNA_END=307 /DNA_ORIENTATION=-